MLVLLFFASSASTLRSLRLNFTAENAKDSQSTQILNRNLTIAALIYFRFGWFTILSPR
jgi:hypothetical protein